MIKSCARQLVAALAMLSSLCGAASAQNYDGSGLVRFGIFGAGEFYDLNSVPSGFGSTSLDGAAIGFSAGYDLVFSRRWAVGLEVDLSVGDTGDRLATVPVHVDYLATLRGRLGAFLTPQWLIYGTAGVAWSGLGIENTVAGVGGGALDSNKTAVGWVAGAGIEYDLQDYFGTLLFAEYLAGSFDSWSQPPGLAFGIDSEVQTFRIGVKFKVGHDYRETYGGPLK